MKTSKTKFYRVKSTRMSMGSVCDNKGDLIDLKERGLDGYCDGSTHKHQWLFYPEWSDCVKEGGKEYLVCLNCLEHSHL